MYKVLDNEAAGTASKTKFTELDPEETEEQDNLTSEEDDPSDVGVIEPMSQGSKLDLPDQMQNTNESFHSDQTDLSDVGLCSLNKHEMYFNIALSMI
jgi:hypothetical protein